MSLNLIVGIRTFDKAIGKKTGELLWDCPEDLAHFKEMTTDSVVIMGRKTHESIKKVLPNRLNYVVGSRFRKKNPNAFYFGNIDEAIKEAFKQQKKVFIIGGGEIYDYVLKNYQHLLSRAWVTKFNTKVTEKENQLVYFNWDLFEDLFSRSKTYRVCDYGIICEYNIKNQDEDNYLNMIEKILLYGSSREDRTNIGTLALFGERLEFDLTRFPLLTTKKMGYKTILKELLWFLSGSTDSKVLESQKVNIWKGNSSRQFLDSRGLNHLPEGDIGAGYGFQFRHFGAEYVNCNTDYSGQGFDQIKYIINLIKTDPHSRRIMLSAWNPADFNKMALPPCHLMVQFFVNKGRLDCQMYQRSADTMLGVPFNIASYAMLVYMIAHLTDLIPGKLVMVFGDTHIYKNHLNGAREQIGRTPYRFPILKIKRKVLDIDDFTLDDFELVDYVSEPAIKLEMAV